ncbi:MAG: M48 family metalloprotease, partial [Acidimicrobiales bacterium]
MMLALGVINSTGLGHDLLNLGAGQAVTAVGVLSGIFIGAAGGFAAVLRPILFAKPWQPPVAIASGIVLAVVLVVLVGSYERLTLRVRGYRRLSRDEVRRVAPVVKDVADAMDLDGLPRFAMSDQVIPNAWTHMRTIVLTTSLLQTLNDEELAGVMAHELAHWRSGDTVGMRVVWACAWPLALTMNLGLWLAGIRAGSSATDGAGRYRGIIVLFGWLIAWPAWVVTTLVIGPVVATHQRRYEYEADAVAKELGYAAALSTALKKMSAFEGGRTGWEYAMRRTHPPTELRLEALQPPRPDDEQYQEDELGAPGWH